MELIRNLTRDLTVPKSKCIRNKCINIESVKITSSSGMYNTVDPNGYDLLLFGT